METSFEWKPEDKYYVNLRDVSREASMKKKMWKFSNFSTADASLASSHWLRPDLDKPGCCLFSDDLILIVLRFHHSFSIQNYGPFFHLKEFEKPVRHRNYIFCINGLICKLLCHVNQFSVLIN